MVRVENPGDSDIALLFLCSAVDQNEAREQALNRYPTKNISVVVQLNKDESWNHQN